MSRAVAEKVLVVFLGTVLCALMSGCSLSLPGELFGGGKDRVGDEPEEKPEAGSARPTDRAVAVSPAAEQVVNGEAPEAPEEAGLPHAGAENYRVLLSFSDLGVIEIVLEGEDASEAAWGPADAEALNRCRTWGHEKMEANLPVQRVRLYRCQGNVASRVAMSAGKTTPVLWRTEDFRRILWNFRSRAEQGDENALKMIQGLAAQRAGLQRRAQRGGAKAWTAWMFSQVMTSGAEVQADTWRCFPRGAGGPNEREVMLGRVSEAGAAVGVGEVSASGASHPAVFRASGSALRWEFGKGHWQKLPHAFVVEPDGVGYQFDVSSSEDGQAESRRIFECQAMR